MALFLAKQKIPSSESHGTPVFLSELLSFRPAADPEENRAAACGAILSLVALHRQFSRRFKDSGSTKRWSELNAALIRAVSTLEGDEIAESMSPYLRFLRSLTADDLKDGFWMGEREALREIENSFEGLLRMQRAPSYKIGK